MVPEELKAAGLVWVAQSPEAMDEGLLEHLLEAEREAAVFVKDLAGRYLRINGAGAQALGCAGPADVVGRTDAELLPPEAAEATRAIDATVLASGRPLSYRQREPGMQGRTWLSTKGVLRDAQGRPTALYGVARLEHGPGARAGGVDLEARGAWRPRRSRPPDQAGPGAGEGPPWRRLAVAKDGTVQVVGLEAR